MEFKDRAVDQPPPPPFRQPHSPPFGQPPYRQPPPAPSGYSYFTEQAIRAGYAVSGFGRAHDYYRDSSSDVREAIQRELEKERIRGEIIAAERARRQALEAEVRREMMIERELALRARGGRAFDRFSFRLEGGVGMEFEQRGLSFRQAKEHTLEGRNAMSLEERLGMGARRESQGLEVVPFQRGSVEPKIKEISPSRLEVPKEKNKIVLLAKPDARLSGSKRKAVQPEESANELQSVGVAKKKVKEEWSCAVCQVSATSERGLNDHIKGKKHKSKEAALRAQRKGKNIGIGVFPKKIAKPAVEVTDNLSSEQGLKSGDQTGKSLLHISTTKRLEENNVSMLQGSRKTDNLKKKTLVGVQKAPKNGQKEKKKFTFWCEMCQVGVYNENVMEAHRKGKKHITRLQKASENNQAITTPQIVGIQGVNDTAKGDNEDFENVEGAANEEDKDYHAATGDAEVLTVDRV